MMKTSQFKEEIIPQEWALFSSEIQYPYVSIIKRPWLDPHRYFPVAA